VPDDSEQATPQSDQFTVPHRPERISFVRDGCLWGDCPKQSGTLVRVTAPNGETVRTRLCDEHWEAAEDDGQTVEVL